MKKVFALFLALLMVVSCMAILPISAADDEETTEITPWDGKKTTPEGTGREKDPYIIDSAGDLAWLAGFTADQRLGRLGRDGKYYYAQYASDPLFTDLGISYKEDGTYLGNSAFENNYPNKYAAYHLPLVANDGSKMDWFDKIYVKQVCDIDLGGNALTPIGNYWSNTQGAKGVKGCYFCGEYDGQGYTIKNGSFKNTGTNGNWRNGAMFGVIWGSTIKNLKFENISSLRNSAKGGAVVVGTAVSFRDLGYSYLVGGYEKIENAKSLIENVIVGDGCTITGAGGEAVGSIVGEASNVTVKNCTSVAQIKIPDNVDRCGGIVGRAFDRVWIENCLFAGKIDIYENGAGPEAHIGGILGSWTTHMNGNQALSYVATGGRNGYSMGRGGIVDCVNLGGFHNGSSGGTFCVGGILGATASLWTAGTDSTYTFENNANLSNSATGTWARKAGLAGCFYITGANGTNSATAVSATYDKDAVFNIIEIKDCFNVASFGTKTYSKLIDGMVNCRTYTSQLSQTVIVNSTNYTRNLHFKALENEAIYPYVDADANMAAFDAAAVAFYEKQYNRVNEIFFGDAAGTAEDPYKVGTINALNWISLHTGSAGNAASERGFRAAWAGKYFVQTADIDLLGTHLWSIGNYADRAIGLTSTALGSGDQQTALTNYRNLKLNAFGGNYNGQGYSIKNGNISDEAGTNDNWASGLFGVIYGATIKNVTLDNMTHMANNNAGFIVGTSIAKSYSDAAPYVAESAAPVANQLYADDFNIIDGCRVVNSTLTVGGALTSANYGAIIGSAHSVTVRNCYTENTVLKQNGDHAVMSMGGIIGRVEAAVKVENCISGTDIIFRTGNAKNTNECAFGGIIGLTPIGAASPAYANDLINTTTGSYFSMKNCVNSGSFKIEGTKAGNSLCYGGLIGNTNYIGFNTTNGIQIVNCYNLNNEITVPASYNWNGKDFRLGALVGCYWIAADADVDEVELINCASVEMPALSTGNAVYVNEKGETMVGNSNAFTYRGDRMTLAGNYPILAVNSSEVPMIATTDKEQATLEALAASVLDELTRSIDGATGIGASAEIDERDRLSLTFYAAIDADVKKEDIKNVVFNITMVNEENVANNYTMDFAGYTTDVDAPEGYDLVAEYTLPLGKRADECFIVSYTISLEMADGSVVTAFNTNFALVYGVVVAE